MMTMPIDFTDMFDAAKPKGAPPVPVPAKKGPGLDFAQTFGEPPKQVSAKEKVQKALAPAVGRIKQAANWEGQGLAVGLHDASRQMHAALDQVKEDLNEPGSEAMPLHGLKTAWDAMNVLWSPASALVDVAVAQPINKAIEKVGGFIQKYAAEGEGGGWKVHKQDIKNAVDDAQELVSAATQASLSLMGGKGTRAIDIPPERAASVARTALKDVQEVAKKVEPKLTPIAASLDKTAGFGRITDKVGPVYNSLPNGTTRSAAAVLGDMIPHAEGYAKSFLEKLQEHVDPEVPVRFKKQAGSYEDSLGVYLPNQHAVEVKTGEPEIIQTTVHEIVHSASINMVDTLIERDIKALETEKGRELTPTEKVLVVNKPQSPILRELDQIVKEARVRAQKAGRRFYGLEGDRSKRNTATAEGQVAYARMSPRYEFLAEAFSNSELQEFLANSEKYASVGYKFKNMMSQLGALLARHFGMQPAETNLLHHAMRVGGQLIKMQSEEKPPSGRSIMDIVGQTSDGAKITRGDIARATVEIGRLVDPKDLRRAKTSLAISVEQLLRTFAPEAIGARAKLAAATVASRITEQMQKEALWRHGSRTRLKFWRARPDWTKEFIQRFEQGKPFSDPVLDKIARKYREWGAKIAETDKKLGFDYEPRENYLSHIFEDTEGVSNYFTRKYGSKWGDPSFVKDRTFDLYKEAVAAGFRPRFDNPEDIMLARQHASDIAEMHIGILNDLASYGLATRKVEGGERLVKELDAEGKMSFRIEKTEGTERPDNTERVRAPNGDIFWVDQQANAILDNAFLSKSLWADKGLGGTAFRGMMSLKNALVPIRLALSLFHPLHILGIDMAAGMTRGLTGLLSGSVPVHRALGEMLASGLGYRPLSELPGVRAVTNPPGWRVLQALRGKVPKEKLTPNDAKALETLIEMGVSPEMSAQYKSNARVNFMNALTDARANFRQGRPIGLAGDLTRATWHLPWAMISAMSKPIFEEWIPALKAASALKDAKNLLARNPELMENPAQRHLAMRKLGKSVENRYGEMNYNTLFWKRWMKDLAVMDTLSLGWQLGFIREYGGGAMDLGQWATQGGKIKQIRKGQLDRPIFVASYTTLGAGVAGLMTYAMTGKPPASLLDYIDPQTGETNPDGSPQRVTTMFYAREFASLYKHIQNEGMVPGVSELVLNKGSGLFGLMHEWATGVNGFGQEIRDPDGDAFKKLEQTLAYTFSDLEPISMRAMQENVTDKPVKAGALSVLGFTPAPKYLTESKTDADIKTAFRNYVAPKETPFEKAEYSKDYSKLREAYQSGSDKYGDLLDKMVEENELSGADQRRLIRSLNSALPATTRMFMRLPWQEQIKVLNHATPEEVDALLPHANRQHVRNVWTPPE
jgi:hypothetical protein